MAVHLSPVCEPRAESTLLDMNQELRSQLAQCKQELRDVKQKLLVSEATAYVLANHLQETNNQDCKALIESMLGEKLQCEEKLADQAGLPEQLKKCDILMQSQKQKVLNLNKKLQDGLEVSCILHKSIHLLVTQEDLDSSPSQALRQKMAEMQGLVELLITKLSPENTEDHTTAETVESSKKRESMDMEEKKMKVEREEDVVMLGNTVKTSANCEQSNIEEEITTAENTTVLSGNDTYPEKRNEELLCTSPPLSMMNKSKLSDEDDNEDTTDKLDEVYLMSSDKYDLSVPYNPYINSRETFYEWEVFSTVNRQGAFKVTVSTFAPDPSLEFADLSFSKSTCQLSEESIPFGSTRWKIMERKLRYSNWRLACRFPGLQT